MANEATSDGARELVDLSAEAVGALGVHLAQIGGLISKGSMPPKRGEWGTARKVKEKYENYKAYCDDVARRKKEIQDKMAEDLRRLREWRKEAGTEGASMIEEIERLYEFTRELKKQVEDEKRNVYDARQKVQRLLPVLEEKDRKLFHLADKYVKQIHINKEERSKRALVSSWIQCAYAEMRFRWMAEQERQKLLIEHHRRMRKAAAQKRLDVITTERTKRLLQKCMLSFQEEAIESRNERHLEELREQHEDKVLIMEAQLAQALGDDEKAKELIAQQVKRVEDLKAKARDLEKQLKLSQRETREWKAKCEKVESELAAMTELQAQTQAKLEATERDLETSRAETAREIALKEEQRELKDQALKALSKSEELVRKKQRRIEYLEAQLAELGAESDEDAPPDERAPPFFVNKDGSKAPRPRTRKERIDMARRDAETARIELRLGIVSMIDKDLANKQEIKALKDDLDVASKEVEEVRWANKVLSQEAEVAAMELEKERQRRAPLLGPSSMMLSSMDTTGSTRLPTDLTVEDLSSTAPLQYPPAVPFASSSGGLTPYSPTRPAFVPAAPLEGQSPRFLVKATSQPVLMPPLQGAPTEPLAPLRKVKKLFDPGFKATWH